MTDGQIDDCMTMLIKGSSLEDIAKSLGVSYETVRYALRFRHPAQYREIMDAKPWRVSADDAAATWLHEHRQLLLGILSEGIGIRKSRMRLRTYGYTGSEGSMYRWWNQQPESHAHKQAQMVRGGKSRSAVRREKKDLTPGNYGGQWLWDSITPMDHPKLKPLRSLSDFNEVERQRLQEKMQAVLGGHLGLATSGVWPGMTWNTHDDMDDIGAIYA